MNKEQLRIALEEAKYFAQQLLDLAYRAKLDRLNLEIIAAKSGNTVMSVISQQTDVLIFSQVELAGKALHSELSRAAELLNSYSTEDKFLCEFASITTEAKHTLGRLHNLQLSGLPVLNHLNIEIALSFSDNPLLVDIVKNIAVGLSQLSEIEKDFTDNIQKVTKFL